MQFKQYPSYKNSGVEWLGDVPEDWEVIPSKFYFTERKEKAESSDKQLTASQKHGIIFQEDFMAENGRVMVVMKNPEILKKVRPNDFVISMRSFQGGLELSYLEGSISSAYVMLKPNLNVVDIEYFKYSFKTTRYIQSLQSTSNLIRDGQALRFNNFSQVKLVLPPKADQQKIVSFLDTEITRIDNLITKQEKLIELLEEQRKSIISHAVTKGLNPNAPMKDSGVEWLGEVPEHWDVTFIKYITKKISSGKTPLGGAEVYTDEGVIFLRSQNIYSDGLHLDDVSFIPHEIHALMKSSAVKKNDVLLNITGGSIGRTCLVDREIGEANVNQHVCIIRTSKDKYAKWLSVFMKSNSAQSQIFYSQTGAGREGLNFSQIGNMRLPFPPFVEQQEILDFLDQENLRFDNLILKQKSLIEKMKEYRSTIISHAVTGKIDVMEFGA